MNTYPSTAYTQWSTDDVAVADRIDYWNDKNTSVLVGLRSSSFDDDGLRAAQTNYDLGGLRLADISGNRHVIERNSEMVRRHPKPAIFASLVLKSKGFFYQGGDCHMLEPGDLILYDIQRPYAIGFNDSMRQLLFDLPSDFLCDQLPPNALARPIKIDGRQGAGRVLAMSLRQRSTDFIGRPHYADAPALRAEVHAVLQTLVSDHLAGKPGTGLSVSYLAAARAYIARNLHKPQLDGSQVAAALGVSSRHLSRLFAAEGATPTEYIRACRLRAARVDLADPGLAHLSVAVIAFKWGFVSQAHFSRVFRQHYGMTPTQARDRNC
ncbi:helix-turn-helix domain-containing protein [Pusillimonas sp.]|uniref:helix-turn-helix domain-containing protein n=1 Tax=Pusillimonas sp. TaxID=3040095 RepID=UPI0037C9AE50